MCFIIAGKHCVSDIYTVCFVIYKKDGRLVAKPLSNDQTPYRKDERDRIKKTGARVLSMDQIEGIEPVHENWGDLNLGKTFLHYFLLFLVTLSWACRGYEIKHKLMF